MKHDVTNMTFLEIKRLYPSIPIDAVVYEYAGRVYIEW